MRPSSSPSSPALRAVHTGRDRFARLYDEEIHPLVGQRFADMLLAALRPAPRSAVLEIGCAAGGLTAELAHRLDLKTRIVALDPSPALIELARARVITEEHAGRRVSFRAHPVEERLPFGDETFDLVLANVALGELRDPAGTIAEWGRVLRTGGELLLATPLRGTWAEFLDLFREALVRTRREDALAPLDAYLAAQPEPDTVVDWLGFAGLEATDTELRQWELVFRSGREFFYAPLIEHGPLPRWKEIVGRGAPMQEAFFAVKEAIDTYYAGHPFTVGVFGGRFGARKG